MPNSSRAYFLRGDSPLESLGVGVAGLNLIGVGSHILVPRPPTGFIRQVATQLADDAVIGGTIFSSDGASSAGAGDFTADVKIGARTFERLAVVASAEPLRSVNMFIGPTEDLILDVTALTPPADRVAGYISWKDFKGDTVLLREALDDAVPTEILIPVGKNAFPVADIAACNWSTLAAQGNNSGALYVYNNDDVAHDILLEIFIGVNPIQQVVAPVNVLSETSISLDWYRPLPPTARVVVTLVDPISTVAPTLFGCYSLVDVVA